MFKPLDQHQIFHLKAENKDYVVCPKSMSLVKNHFIKAHVLKSDAEALRFASEAVSIDGAYLEMGVWQAKTINFIAALNPYQTIHGFDSFEGLPEDWDREDLSFPKGTFHMDAIPPTLANVEIHVGWFHKSLPKFKNEILKKTPIAFLHIDCDLYSSTQTVFRSLETNIVDGTVILFDEFYNFPGFENHEFKSFNEFLSRNNFKAEYLAYNRFHEQVIAKISTS